MPPDETTPQNPETPPAKERPTPPAPPDDRSEPANDARGKDADALAPVLPERISIDARELADALLKILQKYPGVVVKSGPQAQEEKLSTRERVKQGTGRFFKGLGRFLKDFGPPLTGFATAAVAALVFYFGRQTNQRQVEIQGQQVEIAKQQVKIAEQQARNAELQAKSAELQAKNAQEAFNLKFTAEFNDKFDTFNDKNDPGKMEANRLAQYDERALEPLKIKLAMDKENIREGAAFVVFQMFQTETVERSRLHDVLLGYFEKSNNPYLRAGVVECYLKVVQDLSDEEKKRVVGLLRDKLRLDRCDREEDEDFFKKAAMFLGHSPSRDSTDILLKIVGNNSCLREPRSYAIDNLPDAASALTPDERDAVMAALEQIKTNGDDELADSLQDAIKSLRER
jgi:hypothetical protein